jgi:O-antigen ligase
VSWWLELFGLPISGPASAAAATEEGSPLDACVFFALIAAGMYVLAKRQVNLGEAARNNGWLIAFLLYCFLAILWSDFPLVAFKRWIKILGPPTMALVIITEPNFQAALITVIKRCAYVLVLVSALWIKYYPELGLGYDEWSGVPMIRGIAGNKNSLGLDCLILGLFLFWHFLQLRRAERSSARRKELFLVIGLFAANWWLLSMAQSSTSQVCLVLGMLVMVLLGVKHVRKSATSYVVIGAFVIAVAEQTFGISGYLLSFLHRDPTLTERTLLWSDLLKMKTNPIFGVGFESFWLGERLQKLWATYPSLQPNEAHNGYLETYLNLGVIGLGILIGLIIATYRKARLELFRNVQFGRLRLGVLAAVVVHDWTEVSFKGPNALWLVFYIIAIEYPRFTSTFTAEAGSGAGVPEAETELIYAQEELETPTFDREWRMRRRKACLA